MVTYSFYFDNWVLSTFLVVLQISSVFLVFTAFFRWIQLVKVRQNVGRFDMKLLNLEEFTFLLFIGMAIIYYPLFAAWNIIGGNLNWKFKTAEDLIFHMGNHVLFGALIVGELFDIACSL